jgi:hypothetical protein
MDGRLSRREQREQDPAYRSTRPSPGTSRAGLDALRDDVRDDRSMTSRELSDEYWYCMDHRRVEKFEDTDSKNRIGPFPTAEAAAHALQTIAEREKAYDSEDSAWEGDE